MLKQNIPAAPIPNIDLGRTFDLRYENDEVHCEPLGKLADFFGRNMIAHRHDRVFQVHLLTRGEVRLHLDEQFYHARAPLFFLTPPSVTHAFIISDDADGYVLEARQQLIWRLFKSDPSGLLEQRLANPTCVELEPSGNHDGSDGDARERRQLLHYFDLLGAEFAATPHWPRIESGRADAAGICLDGAPVVNLNPDTRQGLASGRCANLSGLQSTDRS